MTSAEPSSTAELTLSEWLGFGRLSASDLSARITSAHVHQARPDALLLRCPFRIHLDANSTTSAFGALHDTVLVTVSCDCSEDESARGFWVNASGGSSRTRRAFFEAHRRTHVLLIPLEWFRGGSSVVIEVEHDINRVDRGRCSSKSPLLSVTLSSAPKVRVENAIAERTVFVFSTARSGSTWLSADVLGWRDRTRIVDEPGFGQLFAPLRWDAERFADLSKVVFYVPSGARFENGSSVRRMPNDVLPVFERLNPSLTGPSAICNPTNLQGFNELVRNCVIHHLLDEWGLDGFQRYIVKMPNESHAADILLGALPEACAIFLTRDGRDVMRSRFGRFSSQILENSKDPALRQYAIAFYSHLWNFQNDIISEACANHDPLKVWRLRYEDLSHNRISVSRALFEWLGLDLAPEDEPAFLRAIDISNAPEGEVGYGKRCGDANVGGFLTTFSNAEIRLMERIMGPVMARFGYSLVEVDPESARGAESVSASMSLYTQLESLREELSEREKKISELKIELRERGIWAKALDQELEAQSLRIRELQIEFERRGDWAQCLDREIAIKNARIVELQKEVERSNNSARDLERLTEKKDLQIAELAKLLEEGEKTLSARSTST